MERCLKRRHKDRNEDAQAILDTLGKPVKKNRNTVIYSKRGPKLKLQSDSTTHGGFDNDVGTLNSTLRIISGSNKLLEDFPG